MLKFKKFGIISKIFWRIWTLKAISVVAFHKKFQIIKKEKKDKKKEKINTNINIIN
jgi:hypothetical protein